MKLYCKGEYHNSPAGLHFAGPGVIDIDNAKAEFLLRDAPDNFSRELPPPSALAADKSSAVTSPVRKPSEQGKEKDKALDEPPADKQVKEPTKKK